MVTAAVQRAPRSTDFEEEIEPWVLLRDPQAERAGLVRAIAESCGLATRHDLGKPVQRAAPVAALFGIPSPLKFPGPELQALAVYRAPVLVYGSDADRWDLAVRSSFFASGVREILDSASSAFELELEDALMILAEQRRNRLDATSRIQKLMRELGVVGESPPMQELYSRILRCRELSDLAVLIRGETGTGKELVARSLHRLDPKRSRGPFVAVNCGALSAQLAESELFGHRQGAFTGATRSRSGLIRSAHGGVLFLDEVGELTLSLQVKLLRVLEESAVLSVGEDRTRPVDVRVLAATNRGLETMVENGEFRADLYYRLDVLSLTVPPLRERRSDVPALVQFFLEQRSTEEHPAPGVSADFLDGVVRLRLPGNVRELRNLVLEALTMWDGREHLSLRDLPRAALEELACMEPRTLTGASEGAGIQPDAASHLIGLFEAAGWSFPQCLNACERVLLQAALERSAGNQARTARLLGVSPRTVYSKLRKHGLRR